MSIPPLIESSFHFVVDLFFSRWPQPVPAMEKLKNCKIVSHRGEHDNRTVFENTMEAFDRVLEAGVWGIELDIRWTRDLHPVVFHDPDLMRLFGSDWRISEISQKELRKHFPMIPHLSEVIQKFGKKLHFMVEIKKEVYPDPSYQNEVLKSLFGSLTPRKDFHILTLSPEMFPILSFTDPSAFLPISETNFIRLSKLSREKRYGGITGHYLFLSNPLLKKHRKIRQKIGTGFISSRNALFRELNRDIDWIFSNHAVKLQSIRNEFLKKAVSP
ncbi:MAG: glycerophosphodiester phosphodiesterase family protein [Pseudomonadota bacterium]